MFAKNVEVSKPKPRTNKNINIDLKNENESTASELMDEIENRYSPSPVSTHREEKTENLPHQNSQTALEEEEGGQDGHENNIESNIERDVSSRGT